MVVAGGVRNFGGIFALFHGATVVIAVLHLFMTTMLKFKGSDN